MKINVKDLAKKSLSKTKKKIKEAREEFNEKAEEFLKEFYAKDEELEELILTEFSEEKIEEAAEDGKFEVRLKFNDSEYVDSLKEYVNILYKLLWNETHDLYLVRTEEDGNELHIPLGLKNEKLLNSVLFKYMKTFNDFGLSFMLTREPLPIVDLKQEEEFVFYLTWKHQLENILDEEDEE